MVKGILIHKAGNKVYIRNLSIKGVIFVENYGEMKKA